MDKKYNWAYKLSGEEVRGLFDRATFFFDTNALLKLYYVSERTAAKIIQTISRYKDRTHITNHVATEYHWNVMEIVADRIVNVQDQIRAFEPDRLFKSIYSSGFLSFIPKDELSPLKSLVEEFSSNTVALLRERKASYEKELNTMSLSSSLCKELTGLILDPLTDAEYETLRQEFAQRAADMIPPGYKDNTNPKRNKKREGISNEAGDYIIWREILHWAENEKKDVIFVSDDLKEDWIWEIHGFKIGPRWELKKEFFKVTDGRTFHILPLNQFLEYSENLTPEEIKELDDAGTVCVSQEEPLKSDYSVTEAKGIKKNIPVPPKEEKKLPDHNAILPAKKEAKKVKL